MGHTEQGYLARCKVMIELHRSHYKQLQQALLSAFPNVPKLEQMVFFQLDQRLAAIAGGDTLTDVVYLH